MTAGAAEDAGLVDEPATAAAPLGKGIRTCRAAGRPQLLVDSPARLASAGRDGLHRRAANVETPGNVPLRNARLEQAANLAIQGSRKHGSNAEFEMAVSK